MSRAERRRPAADAGSTLLEVLLVLLVLGILVGWGSPRFDVAVEQTRVDQAAGALRSLWLAERLHWLEHKAFSDDLAGLADARLVDQALVAQTAPFVFSIEGADDQAFAIEAARSDSSAWTGALAIDETGAITGSTQDEDGHVVSPAP